MPRKLIVAAASFGLSVLLLAVCIRHHASSLAEDHITALCRLRYPPTIKELGKCFSSDYLVEPPRQAYPRTRGSSAGAPSPAAKGSRQAQPRPPDPGLNPARLNRSNVVQFFNMTHSSCRLELTQTNLLLARPIV